MFLEKCACAPYTKIPKLLAYSFPLAFIIEVVVYNCCFNPFKNTLTGAEIWKPPSQKLCDGLSWTLRKRPLTAEAIELSQKLEVSTYYRSRQWMDNGRIRIRLQKFYWLDCRDFCCIILNETLIHLLQVAHISNTKLVFAVILHNLGLY